MKVKKWFNLMPSVMFIMKGGSGTTPHNMDVNDVSLRSNYLTIPLLAVFKPVKWLNLEIGPEFGYLLNYSSSFLNSQRNEWATNSSYVNKTYLNSRIEVSALVGISFDITKNLNLGLQYSYAFNSNLSVNLLDINAFQLGTDNIYNRNLSIIVRYYLINL